LDDDKAEIFSTCLHNIDVLKLKGRLTTPGLEFITRAIIHARKPVR